MSDRRRRAWIALAAGAAFLWPAAGLAQQDAGGRQQSVQRTLTGGARAESKTLNSLFPLMAVSIEPARSVQSAVIDGYTRLVAEFEAVDNSDPARDYQKEQRNWLARYVAGKAVTRMLSVKAKLIRPDVALTTMVSTVTYGSNNRTGESWTTELHPRRVLTPYFRIDPDSAINLEPTTTATTIYSVSAAQSFLDLLQRATKLVVPNATLVTSLNQDRFKDASSFVDQSISNLFQQSITERSNADYVVKDWAQHDRDALLMTIALALPTGNTITPSVRGDATNPKRVRAIGKWRIYAVRPVLSVFSDTPLVEVPRDPTVQPVAARMRNARGPSAPSATDKGRDNDVSLCGSRTGPANANFQQACQVMARLEPSAVLNYPVSDGVPLIQALSGDTGISAARERLIKEADAGGVEANANAYALCSLVADKVYRLGFNRLDTAAILWAYSNQTFVTAKSGVALRNGNNCGPLRIAYAFGLPKGGYEANPPSVAVQAPAAAQPAAPIQPPVQPPVQPAVDPAAQPAGDTPTA